MEDFKRWHESVMAALAHPEEAQATPQATRQDRRRNKELEKNLRRKETTLADNSVSCAAKNTRRDLPCGRRRTISQKDLQRIVGTALDSYRDGARLSCAWINAVISLRTTTDCRFTESPSRDAGLSERGSEPNCLRLRLPASRRLTLRASSGHRSNAATRRTSATVDSCQSLLGLVSFEIVLETSFSSSRCADSRRPRSDRHTLRQRQPPCHVRHSRPAWPLRSPSRRCLATILKSTGGTTSRLASVIAYNS